MCTENLIAVVIPCYKVSAHILELIKRIGPEVSLIYVIDDACPEGSGQLVSQQCSDPRVKVIFNSKNLGVGGAVMTGYSKAILEGARVLVKIDGDGQMDPLLIPYLVKAIFAGEADYTKGNRFYNLEEISQMPKARIVGNAILSFMTKLSSGYWNLFDPTNGFTAIHSNIASQLPFKKISQRYFFETDMLFRLNTLRAVVRDIPMHAQYGDEVSNLRIAKIFKEFLFGHLKNFIKRIFYNYYLRDMSLASIELPVGVLLFSGGSIYGIVSWISSSAQQVTTPPGTVMLSALPILMGVQLILAFLAYDIFSVPRVVISGELQHRNPLTPSEKLNIPFK